MNCPTCSSENTVLTMQSYEGPHHETKESVMIKDIEGYKCNTCGEEFYSKEQARIFSEKAHETGLFPTFPSILPIGQN